MTAGSFLLLFLPLLLVPLGLKPRNWHYAILFNVAVWSAVALQWKRHPLVWWELLIVAVISVLGFGSVYDDLTLAEFRNGKRPSQGRAYWFERGSLLWKLFTKPTWRER